MKAYSRNPWLVENIDEFNFLCCPECAYKSKDENSFESHAVENHPKSSVLFSTTENSSYVVKKKPVVVLKVTNVPKNDSVIDIATVEQYSQLLDENDQDSIMIDLDQIKQDLDDPPEDEFLPEDAFVNETIEIQKENQPNDKNPFYSCPHCEKLFKSFTDVSNHIEIKHENVVTKQQVVKCFDCKKELPRDHEAIKHHMKTEHMPRQELGLMDPIVMEKKTMVPSNQIDPTKKKFTCAYCGDKFPDKTVRVMHERSNHVDLEGNLLEITCKLCEEVLPSSIHFRRHAIDKHKKWNLTNSENKTAYCCEECGKTFKYNKYYTHHKKTAHVDKTKKNFKCDMCDFTTYARRYVSDHKLKAHDDREFKHMCDKCGQKFKYPYYLRVHICPDRELAAEELKCEACALQFTSAKYYMRHFLRRHKTVPPGYEGQEVYKCTHVECDEIFLTPFNLQKHGKLKHSDIPKKVKKEEEVPKYCERCDQHFTKERFLLMHFKTIHNEIPLEYQNRQQFLCDSCDFFCFTKLGLEYHIANKHSKEPGTRQSAGRSYSKINPVNCPICDKTLSSEKRLKEHIANIHEANKTFQCPSCHKAFGTMQGKRQHLKVAKACGKKAIKLENQSARRQQTKGVSRANSHPVTAATNTTTHVYIQNEDQTAVDSLNQIRW